MKCVKCNGEMYLRVSKTGDLFWGCGNYPRCTNTKRYVDPAANTFNFKHTPEQEAIIDHVRTNKKNLVINAVAGSVRLLQSWRLWVLCLKMLRPYSGF
jgi:ssDNA-binding Zn-finger/Zn-ribbon topoisomerase 1